MKKIADELLQIYDLLSSNLPPDPSWPHRKWPLNHGFSPELFEICVGAVLTQNTRWERVEEALDQMSNGLLLSPQTILTCQESKIHSAIRKAGFFRQKTRTLRNLADFWIQTVPGTPSRKELLAINGIGPETADAILLYVFDMPEMIADNYTRRLLSRIGMIEPNDDYKAVKYFLEKNLPQDLELYRNFHSLIIQQCKEVCKSRPRCHHCSLKAFCSMEGV